MRTLSLLFIFCLNSLGAGAQLTLKIIAPDHDPVKELSYKKKNATPAEAYSTLNDVLSALHEQGYLLASADSLKLDSLQITAQVHSGQLYRVARVKMGNLHPAVAAKLGIGEKLYMHRPFRYRELADAFEKIIRYYEDHGHPFVSVRIDSLRISNDSIYGTLDVQKNKQYHIDSLVVVGDAKVNRKFLYRYLSIKPGSLYNEQLIVSAPGKLRQLPFLVTKQEPEARLTQGQNRLVLFLDKKNASQFDGIIGLLPDANTKKTVITGDVKLKVVNGIFKNGETFDLEWRRLQSQTQDLTGRIIYPYLFGTPLGLDYAIKIYRRDTSFIDVNNNIGLQYYYSGLNNFKVFYRTRSSNLISTYGLQGVTQLPDYADVSTQSYGAGFTFENLDYRFNPRKGISFNATAQTGNRQIRKNPNIAEQAYQGLLLNSVQYQMEGQFAAYMPISGRHVLKFSAQAASIFGNAVIFRNELFRIGGLKTLRGFDEESIFASTYVIPTLEYRYLFAQNSYMLVFTEGAWYENTSNGDYLNDVPVSFGAGINFETRAGILGIYYALGNQQNNGFDIRSGKIHFGLTALF